MKQINELGIKSLFPSSELNNQDRYEDYAKRIKKTLYYGRLPLTDRTSLPVTEILVDKFGKFCKQDGFDQLNLHEASSICYDACVTPCSVIVALLYLDRLRTQNPEYLASTSPSQVFIVALMVASKYLYDDGEEDEVFNDEWAASAAILLSDLNEAEKHFLSAIDWNLFVDVKTFMDGLLYVESAIARKQGKLRGHFVYSDLVTLSSCLPLLWTSLLNLVGSALVVCIVGYTATVFVVVAGTHASRECTLYMANQICLNLLPAPAINFTMPLTDYIAPLEKEELLSMAEEDSAEDEPNSPASFSARFHALRTLTTALLLASSPKFEVPSSPTPPYPPSHGPFLGRGDATTLFSEKNVSFSNEAFYKYSLSDPNVPSLPRSKKPRRRGWRKPSPEQNTPLSPNTSTHPYDTLATFSSCNLKSLRLSEDLNQANFYAYTRIIIDSIENFLRSSPLPDPSKPEHNLSPSNCSVFNPYSSIAWTPIKGNYYPKLVLKRDAFTPSWASSSFLPFNSPPKVSDHFQMDWKYDMIMLT